MSELQLDIDAYRDAAANDELGHDWQTCMLSVAVGAESEDDCVTKGWPRWLAELGVWIFDRNRDTAAERGEEFLSAVLAAVKRGADWDQVFADFRMDSVLPMAMESIGEGEEPWRVECRAVVQLALDKQGRPLDEVQKVRATGAAGAARASWAAGAAGAACAVWAAGAVGTARASWAAGAACAVWAAGAVGTAGAARAAGAACAVWAAGAARAAGAACAVWAAGAVGTARAARAAARDRLEQSLYKVLRGGCVKNYHLTERYSLDYTFCVSKTCARDCARHVNSLTPREMEDPKLISMANFTKYCGASHD